MKKSVYKWFWAWDFEKEEKWINSMSNKGLQLIHVGMIKYTFEEGNPGLYTYRKELLANAVSHEESKNYIKFLEETGIEHVASYMSWVYLRRENSGEVFDLFSDIDSKIKHLTRLYQMFFTLFFAEILIFLPNLHGTSSSSNFVSDLSSAVALLLVLVIFLLGYGLIKTHRLLKKLKRERALYE